MSIFQEFFRQYWILWEDWALGYNTLKFEFFSDISLFPIILEATRIYMFINNNHASFHLRWKENLLKVY